MRLFKGGCVLVCRVWARVSVVTAVYARPARVFFLDIILCAHVYLYVCVWVVVRNKAMIKAFVRRGIRRRITNVLLLPLPQQKKSASSTSVRARGLRGCGPNTNLMLNFFCQEINYRHLQIKHCIKDQSINLCYHQLRPYICTKVICRSSLLDRLYQLLAVSRDCCLIWSSNSRFIFNHSM
jgi:hypothetical protein